MLSKQAHEKSQCSIGSQLIYGLVFLTDELLGWKFFCARVHVAPNPLFPSLTGNSYSKQLFPLAASCGAGFWPHFVSLSVAPCLQTPPSLYNCLQFTEDFTVPDTIKASSCIGRCFVLPQDLRNAWEKYSWRTGTPVLTAFLWLQNATSGWERNGSYLCCDMPTCRVLLGRSLIWCQKCIPLSKSLITRCPSSSVGCTVTKTTLYSRH